MVYFQLIKYISDVNSLNNNGSAEEGTPNSGERIGSPVTNSRGSDLNENRGGEATLF